MFNFRMNIDYIALLSTCTEIVSTKDVIPIIIFFPFISILNSAIILRWFERMFINNHIDLVKSIIISENNDN